MSDDLPEGSAEGIIKGMYLLKDGSTPKKGDLRAELMCSSTTLCEVMAAADLLDADFGIQQGLWSCPSFNELARDGVDA